MLCECLIYENACCFRVSLLSFEYSLLFLWEFVQTITQTPLSIDFYVCLSVESLRFANKAYITSNTRLFIYFFILFLSHLIFYILFYFNHKTNNNDNQKITHETVLLTDVMLSNYIHFLFWMYYFLSYFLFSLFSYLPSNSLYQII